ncbi:MAG: DUF262 domain-containing protein [Actinobacteria bacterium]|nr:DUF262 domain-containing protein [Actinomycetota bacterium]
MDEKEELEKEDIDEAELIEDEADKDETVPNVSYDVTSYGSDPEVDGLVRKLERGDVFIPPFQRDYVWRQPEASRFIESLLLGLPVPGIFLATEQETNKQLVIDGQQRLKTLQFFYEGYFNPKPGEKRRRVFSLTKVQKPFEGKTYSDLDERDRVRLDNSIIHATIVKQTSPPGDDTSLYHIFERLNTGGRRLAAQEMRVALYHGNLMNRIRELNDYSIWRNIFGKTHTRLKDQELILRFMALYTDFKDYSRPMGEFLNKYAGRNRNVGDDHLEEPLEAFRNCCNHFWDALGKEIFRPTRALNAAVFDSCMIGLAQRLKKDSHVNPKQIKKAYESLLDDSSYAESVSRSTADEAYVDRRIKLSTSAFSQI